MSVATPCPYERASLGLALTALAATLGSALWRDARPLSVMGWLGLLATTWRLSALEPLPSPWPTSITLTRATATAVLGFVGAALPGWVVAACVLGVFAADGLDGALARKLGAESKVGERVDGESDAFLVMTVSLLLWLRDAAGAWVLIAGLLRYVYVIAVHLRVRRREIPRSPLARYAFAVSLGSLTLGFCLPSPVAWAGPALGTAVLILSFGRAFRYSFA